MESIWSALKPLIPTIVTKAVEAVSSKKCWAATLAFLHIANTQDTVKQVASAIVTFGYLIAQGIHDAAKVKAAAALAPVVAPAPALAPVVGK